MANSKLKTVCENNLTQGIIEQYFSELKRVYLNDRRAVRLDDLVEKLYEQFLVSEQLYCDFKIHKGYRRKRKARNVKNDKDNEEMSHKLVTNLSKKRVTSTVESKFKKRKKQRSGGFYTSPLARKKIKFVGKIEKQTGEANDLHNSSFTRTTDVFAKNNDHKMLLAYIEKRLKPSALNLKEDELIANFCAGLYHLTNSSRKNLNETAFETLTQA